MSVVSQVSAVSGSACYFLPASPSKADLVGHGRANFTQSDCRDHDREGDYLSGTSVYRLRAAWCRWEADRRTGEGWVGALSFVELDHAELASKTSDAG